MDTSLEAVSLTLSDICEELNWKIVPKPFQVQFFAKAALGLGGFLEVSRNPIGIKM